MPVQTMYEWDVFISYSHQDQEWVHNELLPRLKEASVGDRALRVCIDTESFEVGSPLVTEIERAIQNSRKTVLVLTPEYLKSDWATFENIMLSTLDPANRQRRLIPLLLKKCKLPLRIRGLICIDFTGDVDVEAQFSKLLRVLGASEEWLLQELYEEGCEHYEAQRWQKALEHFQQVQALQAGYRDVAERIATVQRELKRAAQMRLLAGAVGFLVLAVVAVLLLRGIHPPQPPPYTAPRPIAFVSDREGNADVYTVEPDGSNLQRLTKANVSDDQAVWSPDGTRIAFVSDRDGIPEIYIMDKTGANVKRITNTRTGGKWHAWASDSTKLVFEWAWDGASHRDIYTVRADGTAQTRLTDGMGIYWNASWSPDGKHIVFVVQRGDAEIFTMNAQGDHWVALTDNEYWDQLPTWSPDGSRIAFVTNRGGVWCMYVITRIALGNMNCCRVLIPINMLPGRPMASGWPSLRSAMGRRISM